MSKHMSMTKGYRDEVKAKYITEFSDLLDKWLAGEGVPDGKLSFVRNLPSVDRKAVVYFTAVAWSKMIAVINEFDKEVAWHGLSRRLEPEDGKQAYLIYDIIVYPQEVTGATVNTDQEEYEEWLDGFDDEIFYAIKMQGHSHVNMGVTPSAVDMEHKENIIRQLKGDMFYIFMIWNKQFKRNVTIYDTGTNVMYDDSDVEVKLYDENGGLDEFIAKAKTLVKNKTFSVTNGVYSSAGVKKDSKTETKTATLKKKDSKEEKKTGETKQKMSYSTFRWGEDDDDNPYSAFGYSNRWGYGGYGY